MRAIGYVRVSSEEQAKEGISLAAQEAKIRSYTALHDLDLIEVVIDAGKSAKNTRREGLTRVMAAIETGDVRAVVVYKLDRLSRRVVDTLSLIERIEASGGAFHSIQEKIDTKSAMGRFFLTITAAFAQMERDMISERTIECLAHKKAQGEHIGRVPYGHALKDGRLVAAEAQKDVISLVSDLRARGATLQAIADHLNARQIETQRGGQWHPTTVRNILGRAR